METSKLGDNIKKGFYSLFDNYNNNDFNRFPKKGSDIKQGISKILSTITKEKDELLNKMTSELGKIPFAPDNEPYYNKQYKHLLGYIPKRFSYDMINHGEQYTKTDNGIEEQAIKQPTKEQAGEMREYNRYTDKYVSVCIDEIKLNTLYRNLEDKKTYNLSVDQMALLGV